MHWMDVPDTGTWAQILGFPNARLEAMPKEGERLKKVRADTRSELRKWTRRRSGREGLGKWLIPEIRTRAHETSQRLPLPRSFINIIQPRPS